MKITRESVAAMVKSRVAVGIIAILLGAGSMQLYTRVVRPVVVTYQNAQQLQAWLVQIGSPRITNLNERLMRLEELANISQDAKTKVLFPPPQPATPPQP